MLLRILQVVFALLLSNNAFSQITEIAVNGRIHPIADAFDPNAKSGTDDRGYRYLGLDNAFHYYSVCPSANSSCEGEYVPAGPGVFKVHSNAGKINGLGGGNLRRDFHFTAPDFESGKTYRIVATQYYDIFTPTKFAYEPAGTSSMLMVGCAGRASDWVPDSTYSLDTRYTGRKVTVVKTIKAEDCPSKELFFSNYIMDFREVKLGNLDIMIVQEITLEEPVVEEDILEDIAPPASPVAIGLGGSSRLKAGAYYNLVSVHSNKCLDVADHSLNNGTRLQQWDCTGEQHQKFELRDEGQGFFSLVGAQSNKCVSAEAVKHDNGTAVIQWDCASGPDQKVRVWDTGLDTYTVRFSHSNKCMDVSGPSLQNGAVVHQWECVGQKNQEWILKEVN